MIPLSFRGAATRLGLGAMVVLVLGCRDQQQVVVPNRVLDRPLDVGLGCARLEDGKVELTSLSACADAPVGCNFEDGANELIGFVTNSEKNELGLFRKCDTEAALVDLDPQSPGYQLVPVGQLPSRIAVTNPACVVVTANAGSCDLSRVDGEQLASFALDVPLEAPPGGITSTIVPRRSNGEPLAARPGDIVFAPERLSLAGSDAVPDGESSVCDPDRPRSVYVTFPACQLVAEVSLATQQILQSRRIETTTAADGTVSYELVDAGTDPSCPIECPVQLQDQTASPRDPYDPNGFFPIALELVERIDLDTQEAGAEESFEPADAEVDYTALFIGGSNSDTVFEISFEIDAAGEEQGQWRPAAESPSLRLEDPKGVQGITATPAMTLQGDPYQFLYIVAADGSTRVIRRDFPDDSLGVECDTQIDPSLAPWSPCHELDSAAPGVSPNRRAFALGPGIRPPVGTITDWTFHRVDESLVANSPAGSIRAPYGAPVPGSGDPPSVVGVGVTSFGRLVYSLFDQYEGVENLPASAETGEVDPVGIMSLRVPPHSLWPSSNPLNDAVALPRVQDEEPTRSQPGPESSSQPLAPSLRRIDRAYDRPEEIDANDPAPWVGLGEPGNVDELGAFEDVEEESTRLYVNPVVRAVVTDYQQWTSQFWELQWEGVIRETSAVGRIECDQPGWRGGTCVPQAEGQSRLIEEGATFCDDGVLPGDKLVLLGCASDDECGLGQVCLTDGSGSGSGLCMSSQAVENDLGRLLQVCRPFLSDPCGTPTREYLITRAYQDQLWLAPLDIPASAHIRIEARDADAECEERTIREYSARHSCQPLPAAPSEQKEACLSDEDCEQYDDDPETTPDDMYCDPEGKCRKDCVGGMPECGRCEVDNDCRGLLPEDPETTETGFGPEALCIDGTCRRPCEPGDPDCLLSPLPGSACFSELVSFSIRSHNSFIVAGTPQVGVITEQVITDPSTGECVLDPTVSNLLTSRIPLGADQAETNALIPECRSSQISPTDPNPCRIVEDRGDGRSLYHRFRYAQGDQPIEAIRYSNPYMTIVVDLVDLLELGGGRPDPECDTPWPPDPFALFDRARIPRGYRMAFEAVDGYVPYSEPLFVESTPMTYPVRIINGPTPGTAYIVDAGGRGGAAGVRGQVIRIRANQIDAGAQTVVDAAFRVR